MIKCFVKQHRDKGYIRTFYNGCIQIFDDNGNEIDFRMSGIIRQTKREAMEDAEIMKKDEGKPFVVQ